MVDTTVGNYTFSLNPVVGPPTPMAHDFQNKAENAQTDQAYQYIRQRILDGSYPPGRRLQTLVLAAEVGLSRSPIRDALNKLEGEGLVEIRPRLGASVRSFNALEFKEVSELRLALESFAAELAARNRSAEDVAEIQDTVEKMASLVSALDREPRSDELLQELVSEDIRFHLAILKAAGNKLIRAEILRLHLLNRVVRMNMDKWANSTNAPKPDPENRHSGVLEVHRRIFEAIKSRDGEAARQAMHEHIGDIIERSVLAMARMERGLSAQKTTRSEGAYAPY